MPIIAWLHPEAKVGREEYECGGEPELSAPDQVATKAENAVNAVIHPTSLAERLFYVPPFLSLASLLAGLFAFIPAQGQVNSWPLVCGPSKAVHDSLVAEKYREQVIQQGLDHLGNAFRLYASPEGAWSAVIFMPNGTACLLDAGEALETFPMKTGVKS